ncbi:MAG: hypothetical protein H7Y05_03925 [Steroidobacteraceae bacterium]|nr:hypothetical protein [Deltaproteobacteria bacterium]
MSQVKKGPSGPFKIKSIRKAAEVEPMPAGSACSLESGDGSDKPPC